MPEIYEQELIERSAAGDLEAFSSLIEAHQTAVCACLAVRLNDPHQVEDLAQETFLTAYRNLGTFDSEKSFGPWLRGIAMNLLRNYWRKKRPNPVGGHAELDIMVDHEIALTTAQENSDKLDHMRDCIQGVQSDARMMVDLRYIEGLSISQICERLNRKHSAVTMKLSRIRQLLRECIVGKMGGAVE